MDFQLLWLVLLGHFFNVAITTNGLVKIDFTSKQFEVSRSGLRDFDKSEMNDPEYLHLKAIFDNAKLNPFSMVSISDYKEDLFPIFPNNSGIDSSKYNRMKNLSKEDRIKMYSLFSS